MRIPQDQKTKLINLVEILLVDDATKQNWITAINQEDTPKEVLFDIATTIEATEGSREKLDKGDKEVSTFFNEIHSDLEGRDKEISSKIDSIEKEVKELEQEFGAKGESHLEENINDQETRSTHEYTRSGQTAQSQHLRVQQPVDSSTPVTSEPSDDNKGDGNQDNKEETQNNPPQPTGYY